MSSVKVFAVVNGKVLEGLGSGNSPTATRIHYLLQGLRKAGGVEVITISYCQSPKRSLSGILYNNIVKTGVALRAAVIFARDRPVVYFEYPDSFTIIQNKYLFKLSKALGLLIALDVHDTREQISSIGAGRAGMKRGFEEDCMRSAHLILALNRPMWEHLEEVYQISEGKRVVLVPNAYEDEFKELYPRIYKSVPGRFNVCYVGGITPNRGVDLLFKACRRAHGVRPELRLYLLGPYGDAFPEDLKEEIESSDFVVRKVVPRKEIPRALRDMDLMAMPYNPEDPYMNLSSPTKLFEYIGTAKPILCTKCHSLLDLGEGEGIMYADYSEEDFEAKLKMLMERPGLREEMSMRIMQMRPKHTWSERARVLKDALVSLSNPYNTSL